MPQVSELEILILAQTLCDDIISHFVEIGKPNQVKAFSIVLFFLLGKLICTVFKTKCLCTACVLFLFEMNRKLCKQFD